MRLRQFIGGLIHTNMIIQNRRAGLAFETLTTLAVIIVVASLLGGMIGAWFGSRRSSLGPDMTHSFMSLSDLMEQSAKQSRDDVDRLRATMADIERVLSAKVDTGLQQGFDRSLAAMADGAKTQTIQLDSFRQEIAAVSAAQTRQGLEIPASLEAFGNRAKLDAIDASKLLLNGLTAGLHRHGLDQGVKIEALSTRVETSARGGDQSVGEFQIVLTERLGDVRIEVGRIGGEMTTTLADNQAKSAKTLAEDLAKLVAHVDAKITEMREGNEAKLLQIQGVVDQKLQDGIEKRMTESFAKITAQFAEVQQAVGEVKAWPARSAT